MNGHVKMSWLKELKTQTHSRKEHVKHRDDGRMAICKCRRFAYSRCISPTYTAILDCKQIDFYYLTKWALCDYSPSR